MRVNLLDFEFHVVVGGIGMKEWTVLSKAVACYVSILLSLVAKISKKSRIFNLEFH